MKLFKKPKRYKVYLIYITGSFMEDTLERKVCVKEITARTKKEAESLGIMSLKNTFGDVTIELCKADKPY